MFKVLIVEDEILVRVGIKTCIDWEKHGYEISGMAEDGIQALKLIETEVPDIVLTDIRMPNMDGLELLGILNQNYPQVKTIILSCYNEVEYVKKALKLGAVDYILKLSMEPAALLEVVESAKQMIVTERDKDNHIRNLESLVNSSRDLLKENLYREMVAGLLPVPEFFKELGKLEMGQVDLPYYVVYGIVEQLPEQIWSGADSEGQRFFKSSLMGIIRDTIDQQFELVSLDNQHYLLVLMFDQTATTETARSQVFECCLKISQAIGGYFNAGISLGIASEADQPHAIYEKVMEAKAAVERRFFYREPVIALFEDCHYESKEFLVPPEIEQTLERAVECQDGVLAKSTLNRLIAEYALTKPAPPFKIKLLALNILATVMKKARKMVVADDMSEMGVEDWEELLFNAAAIFDIQTVLDRFFDETIHFITEMNSNSERPEIKKLKRYINDHISEEMTLEKAVTITNISRCYLSSIFKKETGECFTDYVNRVKMEKARELLADKNLKTYEAALLVGIADESYFSKLFKKYIGLSPSKVKEL